MNKKGFTLIELLAVIVLLAVISVVAGASIVGVNSIIKNNMLEKKADMIEEAALLLADDIKGSIIASDLEYNGNPCKSFIVSDLVPNYLNKDNENDCLTTSSTGTVGCIEDPRDTDSYLDTYEVIIFYKNKRMYAVVDTDDDKTCS